MNHFDCVFESFLWSISIKLFTCLIDWTISNALQAMVDFWCGQLGKIWRANRLCYTSKKPPAIFSTQLSEHAEHASIIRIYYVHRTCWCYKAQPNVVRWNEWRWRVPCSIRNIVFLTDDSAGYYLLTFLLALKACGMKKTVNGGCYFVHYDCTICMTVELVSFNRTQMIW